ncbi:hypothetical protein FHX42_002039 [Saccharopolyspora lacisalsi]|uniref:Uncharacterized protein n=1 Tax=Halosaccharopolyspora lacisalsi TaxID=1000566 RepID=A0A839DRS6_9PSEU|nr:hypothetical protein [Halosaccharopolyspora lacisalsi]
MRAPLGQQVLGLNGMVVPADRYEPEYTWQAT